MRRVIAKGAEAILYLEDWLGLTVLVKERMPKAYRDPAFDKAIRLRRTINEARLMIKAHGLGVPVPDVYDVDLANMRIRMRYIESTTLNELLFKLGYGEGSLRLMARMGELLGILHRNGILHGDPTPANVLVKDSECWLIDFGLGEEANPTWDDRYLHRVALDLNVLLRSLESNHGPHSGELFKAFLGGYSSVVGSSNAGNAVRYVRRLRSLARYMTGRLL